MSSSRRRSFPNPVENGRKGGSVTQAARRASSQPFQGSVLDVADAAGMIGPTWTGARTILKATFAQPMDAADLVFYRAHTEREQPPTTAVPEHWLIKGRRGGGSRMASVVGFYCGIRFDSARLAPGELAVVPVIAADRKQARAIFGYLKALSRLPQFKPWVHRVLRDVIELKTGLNIEVATASYKTIRGATIPAAVLDECAFWSDEGANPDSEILDALRPGMSTVADAVLFAISSPYAKRGELWNTYDRYYGQDDPQVVVWNCDTASLNPTVAPRILTRAFEDDPISAASEYGQNGRVVFRTDVEAYLDADAVAAVTVQDRRELPPMSGCRYLGFVDPSGGSQDSFTVAIAHREGDKAVLDALRERRPPFSPDAVVEEFADLLLSYGITTVTGDRYGGEWPREAFRQHGVRYEPSERTKSDLYRELVAPINAGRVELLDQPTLRAQLVGLERRVARGGKDSIDHAPGGRDDLANAAAGALTLALPATKGKYRVWFTGMTDDKPQVTAPDPREVWDQKQAQKANELVRLGTEDGERRARRDYELSRRTPSQSIGPGDLLDMLKRNTQRNGG